MAKTREDTNIKKSCMECGKNGVILFTCDGCQSCFCAEHVAKHRQDIAVQLNVIGQEHDRFQRELSQKPLSHPILDWITKWEQDSIVKIQQAAEVARNTVQKLEQDRNDALKMSFNQITEKLHSARQENNYSETDLTKWGKKLTTFRKEFSTLLPIRNIQDDKIDPIHLIKIVQDSPITNVDDEEEEKLITDRFETITGPVTLSGEDRRATYDGGVLGGYASVRSLKRYSTGNHILRFHFESKGSNPIFLGIVSASEACIPRTYTSASAYGWRDINFTVRKGVSIDKCTHKEGRAFRSDDQVKLTSDCDNGHLIFEHERTMIRDTLKVDLEACPFPWQIAVSMVGLKDRVRIFH